MRLYHPDGAQPDSEKAVAINQAHDVLMDSEKRAAYDLEIRTQRAPRPMNVKRPNAYPPAYPGMDVPVVQVDVPALAHEFVQAGGEAALNYLLDSNPILKTLLAQVEKQRRAKRK